MKFFLNLPDVIEATGYSKSKIYQMIDRDEFPANRTVKGKAVWLAEEVKNWCIEEFENSEPVQKAS